MSNEWDEYAKEWDTKPDVIEYSEHAFKSLTDLIEIEGLNILDFGCGTGLLSEKMSPKAKQIVAIDSSIEMIEVLRNKNLPNVHVLSELLTEDLINSNDCLSRKFDLIVASSVCGFLPNYNEILGLLKSLLVPNGVFVQWDWLVNDDHSEFGLSKNNIEKGFKHAQLKLESLSEPFTMGEGEESMSVIMAVGRNLSER